MFRQTLLSSPVWSWGLEFSSSEQISPLLFHCLSVSPRVRHLETLGATEFSLSELMAGLTPWVSP